MPAAAHHESYAEFYRASRYAAFAQTHRRSAGPCGFDMIQIDQEAHGFSDPALPEVVIATVLRSRARSWAWSMGDGWRAEPAPPGRLLVLPPDTASDWRVDGQRRLLLCAVSSATVRQLAGEAVAGSLADAFAPLAVRSRREPLVESLMAHLWDSILRAGPLDRLRTEAMLTALLAHLLAVAGRDAAKAGAAWPGLPPAKLRRLIEFAEANLHRDLGLAELAGQAGLSVRHFGRAFRTATGETPHAWLIGRRIARARQLLEEGRAGLAEIALACGFGSQAHFSTVFRRHAGTTPLCWRLERPGVAESENVWPYPERRRG